VVGVLRLQHANHYTKKMRSAEGAEKSRQEYT
jgi:hypothetical protein